MHKTYTAKFTRFRYDTPECNHVRRIWRSWPHLFVTLTMWTLTSMILYSNKCIEHRIRIPRYLKLKTFSRGSSSHRIVGLSFCWFLSFCIWAAQSVSFPLKHCSFCGLCALDSWICGFWSPLPICMEDRRCLNDAANGSRRSQLAFRSPLLVGGGWHSWVPRCPKLHCIPSNLFYTSDLVHLEFICPFTFGFVNVQSSLRSEDKGAP